MAFTPLTTDLSNIQKFDNYPSDDTSPTDIKIAFDKAGNDIKAYINDTLLAELEGGYIASIARTSGNGAAGTSDTYTITFQDTSTYAFSIYNGADGAAGATGDTGDTGATGAAGADGREVELQKTATHIQWRYVGDALWTDLVALADIKGETGATGATGAAGANGTNGADGAAATISIGTVTTGAAGTSVIVTNSGSSSAAVFDITIPRGDPGVDGEGSGDMLKSTYDPTNINASAFNADNHTSGTTNKVYTATEQTKLAGIETGATADMTGAEIRAALGISTLSGSNTGDQTISDATITTTDITTNNASTTKHGFAPKATAPTSGMINYLGIANGETSYANKALFNTANPTTAGFGDSPVVGTSLNVARADHKHGMPATTKDKTAITGILKGNGTNISAASAGTDYAAASHNQAESTLTFTDITTGNVSSTAHGFCPKLPNNTTTFLRGDGTFAAPGGGAQIATGTYTGTGTYGSSNKNSITFTFVPKLVIITDPQDPQVLGKIIGQAAKINTYYDMINYTAYSGIVAWSNENLTMSWYNAANALRQLNTTGTVYSYVAIG